MTYWIGGEVLLISKTPFRISLFGGGTDYPAWFINHPGRVLGFAIDKYCYILIKDNHGYFEHKSKISYSQLEFVHDNLNIGHPAIRACLVYCDLLDANLEMYHVGDLPAKKGLGSSSAFTVGLLNVLYAYKDTKIDKYKLATDAIYVEQQLLNESVGCQDQFHCTYGGVHEFHFTSECTRVVPVNVSNKFITDNFMLFDTGSYRVASAVAREQISNIDKHEKELAQMADIVTQGVKAIAKKDIKAIGALLDISWQLKRELSGKITNPQIDMIYDTAIKAGALGGKLCGAGGGGYLLFAVLPQNQTAVQKALRGLPIIKFGIDRHGSRVIFRHD
ncbi:MAG: kinase [Candidatus Odinarchaeota archaeon]